MASGLFGRLHTEVASQPCPQLLLGGAGYQFTMMQMVDTIMETMTQMVKAIDMMMKMVEMMFEMVLIIILIRHFEMESSCIHNIGFARHYPDIKPWQGIII